MSESSRLRLAVFDCDGTLVDSQHVIVTCMHAAFSGEGILPPTAEAVRRVIGLPLTECMAVLSPLEEAARHLRLTEAYKDHFLTLRQKTDLHEPLFDGALACLDALEAEGWVLGVATGKTRRGLLLSLEHHGLETRFATLQTADILPGKPHPAMLERAMADVGVAPNDTVMIGDTTFDMLMARSAGAGAVGVSWGYHPVAELEAAGAQAIVGHFNELPAAMARS